MNQAKHTGYSGLESIQRYGIVLVCSLAVLHTLAFFAVMLIEKNELRNELIQWSQTLPKTDATQPAKPLHLPESILALHVSKLDRAGFYETHTDKEYLVYANPDNNYILAKSTDGIERETMNFAIMLGVLFAGEMVFLLGWWGFVRSKVRELFEVV